MSQRTRDPSVVEVEGGEEDRRSSWYENDLQLAAELGKTLLERNIDVEAQLVHSQQLCSEQAAEIDLLQKQLEVLRNVNESRQRLYEDIDRSCHELEKSALLANKERLKDKQAIARLTEAVQTLEGRCEELESLLEQRVREAEQRGRRQERQRAHSVPSLCAPPGSAGTPRQQDFHNRYDALGYPSVFSNQLDGSGGAGRQTDAETESLRKSVKALKLQLSIAQNKRKAAEADLSAALGDNQKLSDRLSALSRRAAAAVSSTAVETEDTPILPLVGCCADCRCARQRRAPLADHSRWGAELLEHDLEALPRGGRGQLVRLKNGGSAFGSRESLSMIGLEADDTTPNLEVCSAILASDIADRMNEMSRRDDDAAAAAKNNFSLLGEFEEQYRKLVVRYETLVEAKQLHSTTPQKTPTTVEGGATTCQSEPGRRPHQLSLACQTDLSGASRRSLDVRSSPLDVIDGHFENGPPEYKRLFKEIFDTLRRSVVYEQEAGTAGSGALAGCGGGSATADTARGGVAQAGSATGGAAAGRGSGVAAGISSGRGSKK